MITNNLFANYFQYSKWLKNGNFRHIDSCGNYIHEKEFLDLGVFHKGYATAKDEKGWFHIDVHGNELYPQRYSLIEPFYNGYALVNTFDGRKLIIDETGEVISNIHYLILIDYFIRNLLTTSYFSSGNNY